MDVKDLQLHVMDMIKKEQAVQDIESDAFSKGFINACHQILLYLECEKSGNQPY